MSQLSHDISPSNHEKRRDRSFHVDDVDEDHWMGSIYQCRHCSQCVSQVEEDFLCNPCHRLRQLFPLGETNRRRRGHVFLPKNLIRDAPGLFATERVRILDKNVVAHYFVGGSDWYLVELDSETGDAFGYADLGFGEWGYFNLVELEMTIVDGWLVVERELNFQPRTAAELGIA